MRLRALSKDGPPVALRLKVPGDVHAALTAYTDFYRHQHGVPIEVPELVIEIVRTFISVDREFRTWQRNGHEVAQPAEAKTSPGKEGAR